MSDNQAFDYSGTELAALVAAVNYHRWIFSTIQPYLGDAIVEVGAGIGSISTLLLETSPRKLVAFEPSKNLFPLLVQEVGQDHRVQPINDVFKPHYLPDGVDSLVYVNVLEHIKDDEAELHCAFEALRSGGHLVVFSPALPWLFSDFDKHVGHHRRYTKTGLIDCAKAVGFRIVKAQYFDVLGILPWYINFVLLRGRPGRGSVKLYDKLVVPPMRFAESILSPPIGKSVLLVATKE